MSAHTVLFIYINYEEEKFKIHLNGLFASVFIISIYIKPISIFK